MRDRKRRKSGKKQEKISLKEKLTDVFEIPKEIVLNVPRISLVGNTNIIVENYKGLKEYEDSNIVLSAGNGVIKIGGKALMIKEITSEIIIIDGNITSIEFM